MQTINFVLGEDKSRSRFASRVESESEFEISFCACFPTMSNATPPKCCQVNESRKRVAKLHRAPKIDFGLRKVSQTTTKVQKSLRRAKPNEHFYANSIVEKANRLRNSRCSAAGKPMDPFSSTASADSSLSPTLLISPYVTIFTFSIRGLSHRPRSSSSRTKHPISSTGRASLSQ